MKRKGAFSDQCRKKLTDEQVARMREDKDLIDRFHAGDRSALAKLLKKYDAFACKEAIKHSRLAGVEFEDLVQQARIGLIKAAEKFEPERGFAFLTYANHWVFAIIERYLIDCGRHIRVPVHAHGKYVKLIRGGQTEPKNKSEVDIYWAMGMAPIPIDPHQASEEGGTLFDLADQRYGEGNSAADMVTWMLEMRQDVDLLQKVLASLPEQYRAILECRFFDDKTLPETADVVFARGLTNTKVSRERIRQLEALALKQLRKNFLAVRTNYETD